MVIALCLALLAASSYGAEISLIYPRVMQGQDSFRYEQGIDSSFVFGQVSGASERAELWCNGSVLRREIDGAFLAFLGLPKANETQSWFLSLIERGDTLARKEFAFGRTHAPAEITWRPLDPPVALTVTSPVAHTRTVVGGAYWHFPQKGTELLAVAEAAQWYKFRLAGGLHGVIDKNFVVAQGSADRADRRIGNATVARNGEWTRITFASQGIPLWREQFLGDGDRMDVTLFDCECAIDRIHYVGESAQFVRDVSWSKLQDGLRITIQTNDPIENGYRILASDSTFEISFRESQRAGLRGKLIVIDPGHGGTADGSIGPRGTREKDVTLQWAKILAKELESQGATVALTREYDQELSLVDRVQFARSVGADILLSLHANALPDGENPATRRGTGTYYYHPSSRKLAEAVQSELLESAGLANDGVFDANLALARPTDFPSVLIEAAYMMQPAEELLLRDDKFLVKLSQGVSRGLQRYFREVSAR